MSLFGYTSLSKGSGNRLLVRRRRDGEPDPTRERKFESRLSKRCFASTACFIRFRWTKEPISQT
jgi:hypothetical protein